MTFIVKYSYEIFLCTYIFLYIFFFLYSWNLKHLITAQVSQVSQFAYILSYAIILLEGMMKGGTARKWNCSSNHHHINLWIIIIKKKSEKRHKILHELCFHQRKNTLEGCFADSYTFFYAYTFWILNNILCLKLPQCLKNG